VLAHLVDFLSVSGVGKGSRVKELTDTGRGGGIVESMEDDDGVAATLDSIKKEIYAGTPKRGID
jgi:hypothetical protein